MSISLNIISMRGAILYMIIPCHISGHTAVQEKIAEVFM